MCLTERECFYTWHVNILEEEHSTDTHKQMK